MLPSAALAHAAILPIQNTARAAPPAQLLVKGDTTAANAADPKPAKAVSGRFNPICQKEGDAEKHCLQKPLHSARYLNEYMNGESGAGPCANKTQRRQNQDGNHQRNQPPLLFLTQKSEGFF